jgi:hypothetical protein
LKIYLTLPNCVFVLGMNERVVEEGIGKALEIDDEDRRIDRATAYLEKLCQNVWRLPSVNDPNRLLLEWLAPESTSTADGPDRLAHLIERCLRDKKPCVPGNPRRIKGLANLLRRLAARLPQTAIENVDGAAVRQASLLFVVAYVYQFHHDLYRRLENDPGLYPFILNWVRGYEADLGFLKRLSLPYAITSDETAPTPEWEVTESFPDPDERNVFWAQTLVHDLGQVDETELRPFLGAS